MQNKEELGFIPVDWKPIQVKCVGYVPAPIKEHLYPTEKLHKEKQLVLDFNKKEVK